jgi:stress response protein YsnF
VVLHEEEPVVEKRVVPKERVHLDRDTVTGEERVAEPVRKEQIQVETTAAWSAALKVEEGFVTQGCG